MIKKCICKHEYQDKEYGVGNRVFNPTKKEIAGIKIFRCTVCSREK